MGWCDLQAKLGGFLSDELDLLLAVLDGTDTARSEQADRGSKERMKRTTKLLIAESWQEGKS
jgi:hypothetical protein